MRSIAPLVLTGALIVIVCLLAIGSHGCASSASLVEYQGTDVAVSDDGAETIVSASGALDVLDQQVGLLTRTVIRRDEGSLSGEVYVTVAAGPALIKMSCPWPDGRCTVCASLLGQQGLCTGGE